MAEHPPFVWVDGQMTRWDEATTHITWIATAGISAVYEGIRAYWNTDAQRLYVLQLDAHLARLAQSIRLMRMKQPFTTAQLQKAVFDLLRANDCAGDTYIRPFAYVEAQLFGSAPGDQARMVMNTMPWPSRLKTSRVAHACVSSWTRITDNVMPPRVKAASNYLNSRLAAEEAKRNGYDVSLLLNPNGKVAEAPGACLMIVRDGVLITPSVTSGILESITRTAIMGLAREVLGLEVVEREVDRTEVYAASEAFLCGTGVEVMPIVSVDRLALGDGCPGPVTQQVENLYHDLVRGIDARHPEWRTEV